MVESVKGVKRALVPVVLVLVLGAAIAVLADVLRPSQPDSVAPIQLESTRATKEKSGDDLESDEDRARQPKKRTGRERDRGSRANVRPDGVQDNGAVDDNRGDDYSGGEDDDGGDDGSDD
jgi:hypothetical protein